MKLKVKTEKGQDLTTRQQNEAVIEKFNAQSSKTAKYAKSVVKKRETSEIRGGNNLQVNNTDTQSVAGHSGAGVSNTGGGEMQKKESEGIN